MDELRDLYQEVILDHNRRPRNFGRLEQANREAEGHNPLCGDHIRLYLRVQDGVVREAAFEGAGCAISKASASLMTEAVKNKPLAEVEALFAAFHTMVTQGLSGLEATDQLGKLTVMAGVCEYPVRVKCASLAWHTLQAALKNAGRSVSTE